MVIGEVMQCQCVAFKAKTAEYTCTVFASEALVAYFFADVNIADVYLHHRTTDGSNGIGQCNRGMGVATWVHDNSVVAKTNLVQFINKLTLYIGLKILQLVLWKIDFKLFKKSLEATGTIHAWLPGAKQVKVRAIDNDNTLHKNKSDSQI